VTTVKQLIPQLKAGGGTGTDPQQPEPADPSQGGLTQEQLQQLLEQLQQQQGALPPMG